MNFKMVGADGAVLVQKQAFQEDVAEEKERVNDFTANVLSNFADKMIRACELIGEHPITGKTKVFDTPEQARSWEKEMERDGFIMTPAQPIPVLMPPTVQMVASMELEERHGFNTIH